MKEKIIAIILSCAIILMSILLIDDGICSGGYENEFSDGGNCWTGVLRTFEYNNTRYCALGVYGDDYGPLSRCIKNCNLNIGDSVKGQSAIPIYFENIVPQNSNDTRECTYFGDYR